MPRAARSPSDRKKASREKTRAYRARMRAKGMKLIQVWVPDVSAPGFAEETARESKAIAESPGEADDQAFIDSITDWDDELPIQKGRVNRSDDPFATFAEWASAEDDEAYADL